MFIIPSLNRNLSTVCFLFLLFSNGFFVSEAVPQTIEQGNAKSEVEQFADMAWIKGGKFLRGSSFKENQAALKV